MPGGQVRGDRCRGQVQGDSFWGGMWGGRCGVGCRSGEEGHSAWGP